MIKQIGHAFVAISVFAIVSVFGLDFARSLTVSIATFTASNGIYIVVTSAIYEAKEAAQKWPTQTRP